MALWLKQPDGTPVQVGGSIGPAAASPKIEARQLDYTFAGGQAKIYFATPFASEPAVTATVRKNSATEHDCWVTWIEPDWFIVFLMAGGSGVVDGDHRISWQAIEQGAWTGYDPA